MRYAHKTYARLLRNCQHDGRRLGTASRIDGVWVYYALAGMQWRFQRGRVVGPETINASLFWLCDELTTHTTNV